MDTMVALIYMGQRSRPLPVELSWHIPSQTGMRFSLRTLGYSTNHSVSTDWLGFEVRDLQVGRGVYANM